MTDSLPEHATPEEQDRFTGFVLHRIPEEVRASLTREQWAAIRSAIYRSRPGQGHAVDLRFTVPLGVLRGYVVLQMGRDRRKGGREDARPALPWPLRVANFVAAVLLLCSLSALLFGILYVVKSMLGINLLRDRHLHDLLND